MIGRYIYHKFKQKPSYFPVLDGKSHNSEQLLGDYNVFNTNLRGKSEFYQLILTKIPRVRWYYYTIFQIEKLSNKEVT